MLVLSFTSLLPTESIITLGQLDGLFQKWFLKQVSIDKITLVGRWTEGGRKTQDFRGSPNAEG
jgi:hypothetical protein